MKILFSADVCEKTQNIFHYAVEFAGILKGELIVLYILNKKDQKSIDFEEERDVGKRERIRLMEEKTLEIKSIAKKYNPKIKLSFLFEEGSGAATTEKVSNMVEPDLVVMGTDADMSLHELVFGSTVGKVLETIWPPVFTIPEKEKYKAIKKITFATTLKKKDFVCFEKTLAINKALRAEIEIVILSEDESVAKKEEKAALFVAEVKKKDANIVIKHLFTESIFETLEEYFSLSNSDLLVITKKKTSFIRTLTKEDVSQDAALYKKFKLLTFHI